MLRDHYPEQLKETLELQKTVRQANKILEGINSGKKSLDTPKLVALAKKEPVPPPKTDPKDLKTDEGKMALQKYEEECKKYEAAIQALSDDEKDLLKAREAMSKLSQIVFDEKMPTELRDLIKQDLFRFCREENVYAMKAICGIPDAIISALTTTGGPAVQDKLNEEKLRSEAHHCDVKTTGYILEEYNGGYVILKDGDLNAGLVDGIKSSIPQYQKNIKDLQDKISNPTRSTQDKQADEQELAKERASLAETESKLRNLLAKEKKFNTQEEALEVIAQNHEKNKDMSPKKEGNFRFYEIHAEKVQKGSSYAQDQLLYYNVLDTEERPQRSSI